MAEKKEKVESKDLPAAFSGDDESDVAPSGISIAQTYFSKSKRHLDVGVGYDGLVLNHRNYVNVKDDNGDEIPMEFRFCSSRAGQKEKNERGGFEATFVDPVTNRPLPKESGGKPVPTVGGMTLCCRKVEHGEMRRNHLVSMAMRQPKRKESEINELIREEGLHDLVGSKHTTEKL